MKYYRQADRFEIEKQKVSILSFAGLAIIILLAGKYKWNDKK